MSAKLSQSISQMILLEEKSSAWTAMSFDFNDETIEGLKRIAHRSFNSWQFEKLLNSASDLLDRAIQARSKILDLTSQKLAFDQSRACQDLALDADNFGLMVRKETYGDITVDHIYHAPAIAENQLRIELIDQVSGELSNGTTEMNKALAKALDNYDHGDDTYIQIGRQLQYHQVNSELKRLKAAEIQNNLSLYLSKMNLEASEFEFQNKKKAYQLALSQFKERDIAATGEGVLNFSSEINIWFDVMRRDFLEASARLYAAVIGINKTFDVAHNYQPQEKSLAQTVLFASKFARQLNHWLALATQHDQSYTICISLKTQLSEGDWDNFINGQIVTFTPNKDYFENWLHTRLRGISAMYWSPSASGSIGLQLFPPKKVDNREGDAIDQSDAPEVNLGRVSRSDAPQAMEVAGAVSLMNLSPNGDWWIMLDKRLSKSMTDFSEIEIYLHCVGIPAKSYARLISGNE